MAEASGEALALLLSGDPELWRVIGTSLAVAAAALAAAWIPALAIAYLLAACRFPGRRLLVAALHALLAVPTVAVGLVLFLLLSRDGPLGGLGLLFTPAAIAVGQFCIALPILAAFAYNVLRPDLHAVREHARSMGAGRIAALMTVAAEARRGLTGATLAGFGRIISEVGCALLVGGNIAGSTRTLPTAIALDTARGEYAQGIALGLILLLLALAASAGLFLLRRGDEDHG